MKKFVAAVAAALICVSAWALASTPGSSPDDGYHLASIWCAHGEQPGRCEAVEGDGASRAVPGPAMGLLGCYIGDAAQSGRCTEPAMRDQATLVDTPTGNWQGGYPPVFYWVQGWLVGSQVAQSVLLMRLLAGGVVVGLIACLSWLLPTRLRPVASVPILVTSVPLGLSLFASTNPSSWALAGSATVWLALHGAFQASSGRRSIALCALALLAVVIGAGSRADACLFSLTAVGLAVILNFSRLRSHWRVTLTSVLAVVLASLLFLGAGQANALANGLASDQVTQSSSSLGWWRLAMENLGQLPVLWIGGLGVGPMGTIGWLDTYFPAILGFITFGVLAAVIFTSWSRSFTTASLVTIGLCALAMLVYPLYILGRTSLAVGAGMQPRYLLPLLVIFVGLVMVAGGPSLRRSQVWLLAGAITAAQSVALHIQIRRYVTGLDVSRINLDVGREWWWDIPVTPMSVWVAGSIAFGLLACLVLGQLRPGQPGADGDITKLEDDENVHKHVRVPSRTGAPGEGALVQRKVRSARPPD